MDNDQFLDAYLNTLETSEGAGGGDTVTGMATREYGVKDLLGVKEEDYEGNPKGLAKAVAQKNIDELIRMGIDWDNLPLSMKFNSLDIQFNMGSLNKKAPKYFNALKSGNYETAIKQSLDAIGAYDPKRKGERPTKGIAIRRAMFYNLAAKDLDIPTITSINAINQDNAQKSAKVTYNMSEGAAIPVTYEFQSLHSTTKPGKVAVNEALDIEATPTTEADAQLFTELEQYVPATAKPEPSPAVPDAVSKGQPSAERDITIDYEGEMPDVGEDVPLPTIEEKDVAPDTTDAIPTAEPEEKNIFSRAISGVGEFLFGDDDDTPAKPKVDKNEIIRRSLLKELDTSGVPNMNKGGMPMERQMNMFDEGGLFDEGGTVDEQSGNDVPPGSLKEEVRDDIPAQLSEGEFVFPADVVRYWGLEKLMEMRQEAKAGLARMDAMGQMGNSEEATIPDDLPFTLDDLDMDDDPMEFQVGGLVPNQFGITEQPSQFATYNQQPYVAPTIPTGQPIQQQPLQTGFTPLTTPAVPTDGTVVPTFEQLLPTTTGRYDELKEYINNDTGQTMTIPFVDGKPIYPIPEGFVEVKTDEVEAVETPTTVVPTTQTVSPDDDGDSTNDSTGGGILSFGGTAFKGTVTGNYRSDISFQGLTFGQARKRMTAGVGQFFDFKQNKTPELPKGATATITNIKPPGKDPDGRDARVIRAKVQLDSNFFNRNIANTNVSKRQDLVRVLDYIRKKYDREFLDNKDNVINAELTYQTILEEDKRKETAKAVAEAQRTGNFGDRDDSSPTGYTVGSVIDKAIRDAQQTVRDDYDDEAYSDVSVSQADLEAARQSAPTLSQAQASDGNQVSGIAQDTYEDDSAAYADYGSFFDPAPTETKGTPFNEGGLASKKKPKPKNKMKRGGLASKK